ncbi:MAG: hypothetical protein AAFN92_06075 [Bacteroidota bacterium]
MVIAINLPVVLIFNHSGQLFGVPVLYVFLFTVWLASILLTHSVLNKNA